MLSCLVSANCQGAPLISQLLEFKPFKKSYYPEYFVNFKKEIIPPEKLQTCNLLIYQKLGESWGELSEKYLLAHVNPKAKVVCMPNMYNDALWPISKGTGDLANPYNETYIDELIARNLSLDEILYLIKKVDFANHYDLQAMFDKCIAQERKKGYAGCSELCDYIEENFTKTKLFTTLNHPYGPLLNKVAKLVLEEIGYKGIPDCLIPEISCDDMYYMPVHHSVAKFFHLPFIDENTKFPVYGNMLTYAEYAAGYVFARQNDFPLATYFMYLSEKNNQKKAYRLD